MQTGVVLMTYGSPRDLDDVDAYLTRVRGGRAPDETVLAEFRRRYATIGLSPLVDITRQQAAALEHSLGPDFRVEPGMRFSEPSVASAVATLREAGAQSLLGVILSPQYSPILMSGYRTALEQAARELPARCVEAWHLNPAFVDVLASRVRAALARYPDELRDRVPVLLTAHSLPKRVVDREPEYVEQLQETARAVASAAELAPERWSFVYQSAGHTPEEWLKPDLLDVLPRLAQAGHRDVVVAPVQFLADHLETLYDIDVAGRQQAEAAGFHTFTRTPAPNAAPDFISALATVVKGQLATHPTPAEGPLRLGVQPPPPAPLPRSSGEGEKDELPPLPETGRKRPFHPPLPETGSGGLGGCGSTPAPALHSYLVPRSEAEARSSASSSGYGSIAPSSSGGVPWASR